MDSQLPIPVIGLTVDVEDYKRKRNDYQEAMTAWVRSEIKAVLAEQAADSKVSKELIEAMRGIAKQVIREESK